MPLTFDAVDARRAGVRPRGLRPRGAAEPGQGAAGRQPLRRAGAGRRVAAAGHLAVTEASSRPASPRGGGRARWPRRAAARESVGVVGGGTRSRRGRPGPAPDRELRTGAMRRVVAHEPADLTVTVEAGLPVGRARRAGRERPGSAGPRPRCGPGSTVGGVLAAAASGRERLRSGAVRDSLLEVVLATGDGRLVTAGGRTVKGVAGYDLPRLAVGSLGHARRDRPGDAQAVAGPGRARLVRDRGAPRRARRRRRARAGAARRGPPACC